MATDRGELVRVYEFNGQRFELDGYVDPGKPEAGYDYYDLFDAEDGTCVNFGDPLYAVPSEAEFRAYIATNFG